MTRRLTPELAARFADIALGHVGREYPNKLDHVLNGDADAQTPRALHPVFYGSFDWHSCVHGYWMLARLLRRFPDGGAAPGIAARFDEVFTQEGVEGELAYLQRTLSLGFERPYGWAWLLKLQAELEEGGTAWAAVLRPLAEAFAARFKAFLPKADFPVRAGAHTNTAFALRLALDYALTVEDAALTRLVEERANIWYAADQAAQGWEPSGDDFLSPTLVEAQLMSQLLGESFFNEWLARFLPELPARRPLALFTPVPVSDRSDGKIAHLDGLNLSRAWAWRELSHTLSEELYPLARTAAERHLDASLPHVAGDYFGEHWLATYAVLALDTP